MPRRTRLGAPPEKHEELIPSYVKLAEDLAEGAYQDAQGGRCRMALASLRDAAMAKGGMGAHILSLHGRDRGRYESTYNRVAKQIDRALDAIDAKCSKQPGKW